MIKRSLFLQIGLLAAVFACVPLELAISGVLMLAVALVDYIFDPARFRRRTDSGQQ